VRVEEGLRNVATLKEHFWIREAAGDGEVREVARQATLSHVSFGWDCITERRFADLAVASQSALLVRYLRSRGGGDLWSGWQIGFDSSQEGVERFLLLHDRRAMAQCVLCYSEPASAAAWARLPHPGWHPLPPTPWLAGILLVEPEQGLPAAIFGELDEIQRSVAWTLLTDGAELHTSLRGAA